MVFLYSYCYQYQVYAITDDNIIYRMWLNGADPLIEKLIGNELEHSNPINILKAMKIAR